MADRRYTAVARNFRALCCKRHSWKLDTMVSGRSEGLVSGWMASVLASSLQSAFVEHLLGLFLRHWFLGLSPGWLMVPNLVSVL